MSAILENPLAESAATASVVGRASFLSAEEIENIRSFVWQGCNDAELRYGLAVCQFLGLNPLLKHVVFIKSGHGGQGNIYTTRDGLLHMAHQSGQFNGMQSGVQYAQNKEGEVVRTNNRKVIEGAWCKVYRKDMDYPFEVEVNFEEYNRPRSQVWQQYPAAMIKKVAEHMALKLAFNVSGLASVEEMGFEETRSHENKFTTRRSEQLDSAIQLEKQQRIEKQNQQSMKILIDTIRQLQQKYALSTEEIQEVTQRQTLRGLTLQELEQVILSLNNHCLHRPPASRTESLKAEPERLSETFTATSSLEPLELEKPEENELESEPSDLECEVQTPEPDELASVGKSGPQRKAKSSNKRA